MAGKNKDGAMRLGEKVSFGMGPIGKNMCSSLVYGSFLSLYFMQTLNISAAYLSVMFLLCRIWDGVNDLFMGAIIDAVHSRFGKFRPWIFFGALTNSICTILIYWDPGFRGAMIYAYVTILYLLCDLTFTMIDVSYWALIPALTLDRKERDQVSVIPRLTGAIGGAVSSFTLNIVDALGGRGSNSGFLKYALIASVVYIATSTICAANANERVHDITVSTEKFSLIRSAKILFGNDQALTVVIIMLLFNAANCVTTAVMMYYFMYVIDSESFFGTFNILTGVISGIGLLGFPLISKKINRNKIYLTAYLMPIVGYILMALVGSMSSFNMILFIIAAAIPFIAYGAMGVMENVMLADAVDYGEWKTGVRAVAVTTSAGSVGQKLGSGLGTALLGLVLSAAGYNGLAAVQTEAAVSSIKFIFVVFPIALYVLLLVIMRFYDLDDMLPTIKKDLEARNAGTDSAV